MAILYYPKSQILARRDASNPLYEQLILANNPDMVFYFDTGSGINAASASNLYITSSWADTSSYSVTSSFALNGGGGGSSVESLYETILTGSNNGITASFTGQPTQQVNLTRTASYTFTSIGSPTSGKVADIVLYISHSANTNTSSLVWPASWVAIGNGFPTYINSNKVAVLWLRAIDTGTVMGTFTAQQ